VQQIAILAVHALVLAVQQIASSAELTFRRLEYLVPFLDGRGFIQQGRKRTSSSDCCDSLRRGYGGRIIHDGPHYLGPRAPFFFFFGGGGPSLVCAGVGLCGVTSALLVIRGTERQVLSISSKTPPHN
jgi:hypothetical protein